MSIKSDKWIRKMSLENKMITPFTDNQVRKGTISYGLSSYGYDIRVSDEYKIFTNVNNSIVDPKKFDAKVLKSFDRYVVLDKTSFYARGGGQEPDHGKINDFEVVDVTKHGDIVVHELKDGIPKQGDAVSCVVDSTRRDGITKNHTSTHILNTSARSVLGSWVWQHSAFKEEDHARLDITHHSALTEEEVSQIEQTANSIVEKDIQVKIENFDRGTAEQKYGFRIYQGGVVPVKSVRIVSIGDLDIEACGGTHVKKHLK